MLFGVCFEHEYDLIMFIAIRSLVFALSINMIGSCLSQNGYSIKPKNNCCSVYMNKTSYGLTSNVNGLLNLDHSDTHNIDAKRCTTAYVILV